MTWLPWVLGAAFALACLVAYGYRLMYLAETDRANAGWDRVDEQHEHWGRDMDTWEQRAAEWRTQFVIMSDEVCRLQSELDRVRAEGYGRGILGV